MSFISGCFIVVHRDFTVKASTLNGNSGSYTSRCYTNYSDSRELLRVLYLYNNGVLIYYSAFCKREEIDSQMHAFSNIKAIKMSDIESGAYVIRGSEIKMNYISHFHYGNFKVSKMNGLIQVDKQIVVKTRQIMKSNPYATNDTFLVYNAIKPDSTNWLMKKKWYWYN